MLTVPGAVARSHSSAGAAAQTGRVSPTVASTRTPPSSAACTAATGAAVEHPDARTRQAERVGDLGDMGGHVRAAVVRRNLRVDDPRAEPDAPSHRRRRRGVQRRTEAPRQGGHRGRRHPVEGAELGGGRAQYSMPFMARMPRLYACFTIFISVTVSAISTSSGKASRPVTTTFVFGARSRMASTTSAAETQP